MSIRSGFIRNNFVPVTKSTTADRLRELGNGWALDCPALNVAQGTADQVIDSFSRARLTSAQVSRIKSEVVLIAQRYNSDFTLKQILEFCIAANICPARLTESDMYTLIVYPLIVFKRIHQVGTTITPDGVAPMFASVVVPIPIVQSKMFLSDPVKMNKERGKRKSFIDGIFASLGHLFEHDKKDIAIEIAITALGSNWKQELNNLRERSSCSNTAEITQWLES